MRFFKSFENSLERSILDSRAFKTKTKKPHHTPQTKKNQKGSKPEVNQSER